MSSPHANPHELLINVSKLILGPVGTQVCLVLGRDMSATDLDQNSEDSGESCTGFRV